MSGSHELLTVAEVRSRYDRIEVLHGVSLGVSEGEVVAIIGANGAGKTTLMRAISGVQPISGGSITFRGESLEHVPAHVRVARGIAQVPEGRHIFAPLSVADNLLMGSWSLSKAERADRSRYEWAYQAFPILCEKRDIPAGRLSGGQQQMLAIGRAMVVRPKLLLLDEPSMGLSPLVVEQVFDALRRLKDDGMTILLIEQNAEVALEIADRAYVMETGTIAIEGPARDIANDARVQEAYLGGA